MSDTRIRSDGDVILDARGSRGAKVIVGEDIDLNPEAGGEVKIGGVPVVLPLGGGVPGYYVFPFAFDDAGLNTGLTVYTPSVGDGTVFLLDAAIIADTPFDGTTPQCDIGTGVDVATGLIAAASNSSGWELANGDDESAGAGLQINPQGGPGGYGWLLAVSGGVGGNGRYGYAAFTALNPLKLWVSQDGTLGGDAVGGAAGAARLIFSIAKPIPVP